MKIKFIFTAIPLIIFIACSDNNEQNKMDYKPSSEIDSLESLKQYKSAEVDSLKKDLEMLRNKRDSLKSESN